MEITKISSFKYASGLCIALCLALPSASYATDAYQDAKNHVKNQICAGGATVDGDLDRKFRHTNHLSGWHTLARKGGYDVERTVKVSKFAELRYRWRVDAAGSMSPASFRAQTLCSPQAHY